MRCSWMIRSSTGGSQSRYHVALGIDHRHRAVLADAQAIGLGAKHAVVGQAQLDQAPLQVVPRDNRPLAVAALRFGLVAAQEDVALRASEAQLLDERGLRLVAFGVGHLAIIAPCVSRLDPARAQRAPTGVDICRMTISRPSGRRCHRRVHHRRPRRRRRVARHHVEDPPRGHRELPDHEDAARPHRRVRPAAHRLAQPEERRRMGHQADGVVGVCQRPARAVGLRQAGVAQSALHGAPGLAGDRRAGRRSAGVDAVDQAVRCGPRSST